MRITSGKARGISLKSPKGDATRPATDAARQAIFSSLAEFVEGAYVCDLFAGTGSYGLEAISRGADRAVFYEKDRNALECLRTNIESVGKALGRIDARVVSKDAFTAEPAGAFDLLFADPPYGLLQREPEALFALLKKFSGPETLAVLEAPADFEALPVEFEILKRLGKKGRGKPTQLIMRLKP